MQHAVGAMQERQEVEWTYRVPEAHSPTPHLALLQQERQQEGLHEAGQPSSQVPMPLPLQEVLLLLGGRPLSQMLVRLLVS